MIDFLAFPQGASRIVTFSYDDGHSNDERLVALFDQYGVKGTFHLNSKRPRTDEEQAALHARYRGHEISCHTKDHIWSDSTPLSLVAVQTVENRRDLEKIAGYPVLGMSYPYGEHRPEVARVMADCGIVYSRTTQSTFGFDLPHDFMHWDPTCHHKDADKAVPKFLSQLSSPYGRPLLYIWGHSHEFKTEEDWAKMEQTVSAVSALPGVWYATNIEIYRYLRAQRALRITVDESVIENPTNTDVWIRKDGQTVCVPAGSGICD